MVLGLLCTVLGWGVGGHFGFFLCHFGDRRVLRLGSLSSLWGAHGAAGGVMGSLGAVYGAIRREMGRYGVIGGDMGGL